MKRTVMLLTSVIIIGTHAHTSIAAEQIEWQKIPEATKDVLSRAHQEMNRTQYSKAIEILLRFQKRSPRYNHFLVEFNLGTAYGLNGQPERGIEHLEKATSMEQEYAPSWLNLGKLYYQTKAFTKAGAALERGFATSSTKDPEILYMAMAAYFQGDALPDAIRIGEELVFTYKSPKEAVISLLANAYLTTKNFPAAITTLRYLLAHTPHNEKAWKLLCSAHFNNQEYREATIAYEIYGYLHGLDHEERKVMGDLFFLSGIPLRAAQYYELALQEGGTPEEYEKLSVYYYSAHEIDEALTSLEEAITKETTAERLLLKAQLFYLQDKFGEAETYYARAAEMLTRDGHEWLMAGYCAMRNGDTRNARQWLSKALDYPSQRQEAQNILKLLEPAEEIRHLMAAYKMEEPHF